VLALTACAGVLTGLGLAVMSVAFPAIVEAFPEASEAELSWVTNIFPIVGAATLVLAGVFADRYGRKRMLLIGVAVFTVGSCLSAIAGSPGALIAGRGVQSLGASAYTPAATALLIAAFPAHRLPLAIGVWAVAGGISSAAAPAVGGLAIDAGGWRWAFWMNVPVALFVLALGPWVFQESVTDRSRRFPDPFGAVLIMVGLSLVVLGVVQSGSWGWLGGKTLAAFAGGVATLGWLAWRCTHRSDPILRLSLLREASAGPANLGMLVFATAWFCLFFALVFYFTTVWEWSAVRAGLASAPISLVSGVVAVAVSPVAARRGHRRFLLVGSVAYTLSVVWLWAIVDTEPNWAHLIPAEIVLGAASGLVLPSFIALGVVGIQPHLHAVASSVSFTTQRVGTSLGTALAITFLADTSLQGTAWLHRAMVVALAGSVAAFVISLRVGRPPAPVPVPAPAT
jgi:MFS family permease